MFSSLLSILGIAALAITAFGLGRPLLRLCRLDESDALAVAVYSVGLGLVAASGILWTLGLAGWLYPPVIVVLTVAGCCWGLFAISLGWLTRAERASETVREVPLEEFLAIAHRDCLPPFWLRLGMLAVVAAVLSSTLVSALAPPTSGDRLGMRLCEVKTLLLEHGTRDIHAGHAAVATSPVDLWYLWAMALEGETCAQVFQWGLSVLLALGVVLLAGPILGRPWAWMAGGLTLASPGIHQQMSALPDAIALATLATLATAAWWQATIHNENGRWLILAGALAGGAIAVDWATAGLFFAAVALCWAAALWRQAEQRPLLLQGATITVGVALGVGGLHILPGLFLGGDTHSGVTPNQLRGEVVDVLGFVVLAAAPGLFLSRKLRGMGPVVVTALACIALGCLKKDGRLLAAAVPSACVAAVWTWMEMRRFPRRALRTAGAAFALMLAATAAVPLLRSCDAVRVTLGLECRENYLLCREPTYRAAVVANEMLPSDARILSQEEGTLYFDRRVTSEDAFRRRIGDVEHRATSGELLQRLQETGFTHVLLAETVGNPTPVLYRPIGPLADRDLLDSYPFRRPDGTLRRYRLVTLR